MVAWEEYKLNSSSGTSVAHLLDKTRMLQIRKNHHYIKTVAQVLLYCAHQEIALRGHDESESSPNKGNFLKLMYLMIL